MNYPFILKFSSINNLSDARFAAGSWADFIGFNFDPNHPKYMEPSKAKEIISWINGPIVCGEFAYQPIEWLNDFIDSLNLKTIQIPNDYKDISIFSKDGIKFILSVKDANQIENIEKADILLVDNIETYQALKALTDQLIILETEDLALDAKSYDGIAMIGIDEEKPGTRNHAEWIDFIEKWEEA